MYYSPWIKFVQSSKPFLSLPFGTGLSKWINQVNLLICQNRISKQKNCKRKARGGSWSVTTMITATIFPIGDFETKLAPYTCLLLYTKHYCNCSNWSTTPTIPDRYDQLILALGNQFALGGKRRKSGASFSLRKTSGPFWANFPLWHIFKRL